jgi:hypothetical protein
MASECLIRLKEHSDKKVAAEAVRLANLAAKTEMKTIGRLMASISTDERLMLSKRIRQMRSGTGQQTLALILCIENKVIRKRLIEFLEKADANSADLLSRCLLTGRNEAVELTLAPVFSGILDEFFTELFDGIEIINIIGNGTLEEKDESPQLISGMNFLSAILAEVAVIAEKELPVDLESKFNKRVEVACSAFLCLSHDPMPLLTSLEQLNSSRRHVASMAQEFIESHIGKNHAQLVVEIMKKSKTKDADASQLIDYGQSMGLNVSDATLELARTRLDYYLFSERNHS